jgi:Pretoxin HINT domain
VTARHPIWSLDRGAWVSTGELEIGERLSGRAGPVRVVARTLCAQPEEVYNLEVEGEHCYRVGEQGILVHNSSASPCTNAFAVASKDVDETITCAGSQFPWTGSGQAPNWATYTSVKAYGNFRSDHGKTLTPQQLQNAANNQNNACRQTQFYDDSIVVLIEQRTPPCPGKYVIEMGMAIGRQFVRGGSASSPIEGLTKAFVGRRQDGTIFSIYPVRDAFQINEGKCPPGPDLPGAP